MKSWGWLTLFTLSLLEAASGQVEPGFLYFEMVRLPAAEIWVARCEVTQKQYREITGENPSFFRGDYRPVDSVTWEDAVSFCAALTRREHGNGRLPSEFAYELPTDAQWDLFAAGTDPKNGVTSLTQPRGETGTVGQQAANPLGLFDVVGNVWEWCRDWYDNSIRKKDANKDMPYVLTDAEAAAQGPEEVYKVLRGGAWDTNAADGFTLASRRRYAPGMSNNRTGFRCMLVRVGEPSGNAGAGNKSPGDPLPPRR